MARLSVLIVAQAGRLQAEALIFAAALAQTSPDAQLFVAEPQPGPLWPTDPRLDPDARTALTGLGATVLPLNAQHFGASYPQGNKIEALALLPPNQPFVFFDTDTLILSDLGAVPFDFDRPSASLRREGTWPEPQLYGPGYGAIWQSLYDRFGLDLETSLDPTQPDEHWRRYLYFNAGAFFYRCPRVFHHRYLTMALSIRDDPPAALTGQALDPWLDQIALPLVIHALCGGRDTLAPGWIDGRTSCHYRALPLLYAREDDETVAAFEALAMRADLAPLVMRDAAFRRIVAEGRGPRIRALFKQDTLPRQESVIRKRIKRAGLWYR